MKNKKRGNPKWVKGGASPNPTGRPKDGESWAAIIKSVGDMYPADLIAFIGKDNDLGQMLAKLPKDVQMKYLVTARVFSALMFEPASGLWKELMERAEGKVVDKLDLNADTVQRVIIEYAGDSNEDKTSQTPRGTSTDQSESEEV